MWDFWGVLCGSWMILAGGGAPKAPWFPPGLVALPEPAVIPDIPVFPGHRTLYVGVRMPLVRQGHRHHRAHSQKHRKREREKEPGPAEQGFHCESCRGAHHGHFQPGPSGYFLWLFERGKVVFYSKTPLFPNFSLVLELNP